MIIDNLGEVTTAEDDDLLVISTDRTHLKKISLKNLFKNTPKAGSTYVNDVTPTTNYVATGRLTLNGNEFEIYIPKVMPSLTSNDGVPIGQVGDEIFYAPVPTREEAYGATATTQTATINFNVNQIGSFEDWDMMEVYFADNGVNTNLVPCYIYKDLTQNNTPMSYCMPSGGYVTFVPVYTDDELSGINVSHFNNANTYVARINVVKL